MTLKVRFSEKYNQLIKEKENISNYYELEDKQAIEIFLPNKFEYKIVSENEEADICIVGIQHQDNNLLKENEVNVFLSLENFSVGRKHYKHFNMFERKNPKVNIYFYNDISFVNVEKNWIPVVYCRIKYFNSIYNNFDFIRKRTNFKDKKFCLFTSRNLLNNNKKIIYNELSKFGKIDTLDMFDKRVKNKTCYNSIELLELYNEYKFVLSIENSHTDGYVTEKVFNVFLAGSIPIYDGAPNILDYLNNDSFIKFDEKMSKKIELIVNNENLYNNMIKRSKTKELDYSQIDNIFEKYFN